MFTAFPKVVEREIPAQFPTLHHFPPFYTTPTHYFPYLTPPLPTVFGDEKSPDLRSGLGEAGLLTESCDDPNALLGELRVICELPYHGFAQALDGLLSG